MGARAEQLAQRFEDVNRQVMETVQHCSAAQWTATCAGEEWPVRVGASHIADAHRYVRDMVASVAEGRGFPAVSWDEIHAANARMAEQHAATTQEQALEALRANGAQAAAYVRSLSDEQLDRTTPVPLLGNQTLSTQQLIELILIGHPEGHLKSMRAAANL